MKVWVLLNKWIDTNSGWQKAWSGPFKPFQLLTHPVLWWLREEKVDDDEMDDLVNEDVDVVRIDDEESNYFGGWRGRLWLSVMCAPDNIDDKFFGWGWQEDPDQFQLKMVISILDEDQVGSYIPRALLPSYIFKHCCHLAHSKMPINLLDEHDTRIRWVPTFKEQSYIFKHCCLHAYFK